MIEFSFTKDTSPGRYTGREVKLRQPHASMARPREIEIMLVSLKYGLRS